MKTKRRGRGRGTYESGRPPVITIIERTTSRVKFFVAKNLSSETINSLLRNHTEGPLTVYTDDYTVYCRVSDLDFVIEHRVVSHSLGDFGNGRDHTNTAEGIHSHLRVFLSVHRGPNRGNLQIYVSLFAYTHNKGRNWFKSLLKACLEKAKGLKR